MLPGFRFLFVAVVLSMSTVVFGLGAAALLRSAHEEFVNLPGRRPPPETVFAQRLEDTTATLAMLRVDTPAPGPADTAPAIVTETPTPAAEQPAAPAAIVADKLGAPVLSIPSEQQPDAQKPEASDKPAETPAQAEPPPRAEAPAAPVEEQKPETPKVETRVASIQQPPPSADQAAASEPPAIPPSDGASAAATRIATLGGPEVVIEAKPAAAAAKNTGAGKSATPAKRAQKHRVKRRRIVRPRVAPPATLGFFDPMPTPVRSPGRVDRSAL